MARSSRASSLARHEPRRSQLGSPPLGVTVGAVGGGYPLWPR
ncbi:Uncharacterised protein [Vibrio cholerae]|nr:Uncharacterised protein [Vibrio cholerae]